MKIASKEKFLKTYANVPISARQEIVLTIDGRPITWDVAFFEIDNNSPRALEILEKLEKFRVPF